MVMETKEDIVNYINAHDNPLALYVFTQKTANRDYSASPPPPFLSSLISPRTVFRRTRSGTFVQNDVLVVRVALLTTHLPNPPLQQFAIPGLPFGGAGPSGYGNYHGKKCASFPSRRPPSLTVFAGPSTRSATSAPRPRSQCTWTSCSLRATLLTPVRPSSLLGGGD